MTRYDWKLLSPAARKAAFKAWLTRPTDTAKLLAARTKLRDELLDRGTQRSFPYNKIGHLRSDWRRSRWPSTP